MAPLVFGSSLIHHSFQQQQQKSHGTPRQLLPLPATSSGGRPFAPSVASDSGGRPAGCPAARDRRAFSGVQQDAAYNCTSGTSCSGPLEALVSGLSVREAAAAHRCSGGLQGAPHVCVALLVLGDGPQPIVRSFSWSS